MTEIVEKVVKLPELVLDARAQPRASLSKETIDEYTEVFKEGGIFPPIRVFEGVDGQVLSDGFHRVNAARQAGFSEIMAKVSAGTMRDAILASVGANASHGLRRTAEDKRKAILTLLEDPEWGGWSDRDIARKAAVPRRLVAQVRAELQATKALAAGETPTEPEKEIRKAKRKGKEYEFDAKAINKGRKKKKAKKAKKPKAVPAEKPATYGEILVEMVKAEPPEAHQILAEIRACKDIPHESAFAKFAQLVHNLAFELAEPDQRGGMATVAAE